MRIISLLFVILMVTSAIADKVTVDLDRVAFITPSQEDAGEYGTRIAIYFDIPEAMEGAKIVYAELNIPLDFTNADIDGEKVLEFQAFDITTDWTDENAEWDSPWTNDGGDIDSTTFYTYTLTMDGETNTFLDITHFVRRMVETEASNYGLMLFPVKHDEDVFHINSSFETVIENSAQVKIVYH